MHISSRPVPCCPDITLLVEFLFTNIRICHSLYYDTADISGIANGVKNVPPEYINEAHNGITEACLDYLAPLIVGEVSPKYENGLPKHIII